MNNEASDSKDISVVVIALILAVPLWLAISSLGPLGNFALIIAAIEVSPLIKILLK